MKVDKFVGNLWIQLNYLRGFSDALQHPALAEFIEETVELIDKFEKEWDDEQVDAEEESEAVESGLREAGECHTEVGSNGSLNGQPEGD